MKIKSAHVAWWLVAALLLATVVLGVLAFAYRDNLARTSSQLSDEERRASSLEAEVSQLEDDVEQLEDERSDLEDEVSGLEGELGSAEGAVGSLVVAIEDCWAALRVAADAYNSMVDAYNASLIPDWLTVDEEFDYQDFELLPAWDRAERRCFNPPQAPPAPPDVAVPL